MTCDVRSEEEEEEEKPGRQNVLKEISQWGFAFAQLCSVVLLYITGRSRRRKTAPKVFVNGAVL